MQRGTQDVEVDLLGSLRIRTAYGACVVNSARLRSVLAVLTLQVGAVVGVDELIDELWGRNPPNKARNALQASAAAPALWCARRPDGNWTRKVDKKFVEV